MTNPNRRFIFFDITSYTGQSTPVVIVRATRTWIQFGVFGFAVLCIIIGAIEAFFER